MDLYRYFHPHHNPRLLLVPLRLQELGELEQAAAELKKAVRRAAIRSENAAKQAATEDALEIEQTLPDEQSQSLNQQISVDNLGSKAADPHIQQERFSEVLAALEFVVDSLADFSNLHPGDETATIHALLRERGEAPGWENWARLLEQRLELLGQHEISEIGAQQAPPDKTSDPQES